MPHPQLMLTAARSFDALAHGLTAKKSPDSFIEWYSQLVSHGNFASQYSISGFYIMKPKAMFVWDKIKGNTSNCCHI